MNDAGSVPGRVSMEGILHRGRRGGNRENFQTGTRRSRGFP
jgi:hypothetical protein